MKRDLIGFLIFQAIAAGTAVGSFSMISERSLAGLVAGMTFVALGTWMLIKTLRWPNKFRYLTFYLARLHLWLFALPMILVRLRYWGVDFNQLYFFSIPGPLFHKFSEYTFLLLVFGTLVDLARILRVRPTSHVDNPK